MATVTLTTTDGVGTSSSTIPFNLAMTDVGGGIDQITLRLFSARTGNPNTTVGSLAFLDNYSILTIPEPSILGLLAVGAGLTMILRRKGNRG